jgi:hypothetical protein
MSVWDVPKTGRLSPSARRDLRDSCAAQLESESATPPARRWAALTLADLARSGGVSARDQRERTAEERVRDARQFLRGSPAPDAQRRLDDARQFLHGSPDEGAAERLADARAFLRRP